MNTSRFSFAAAALLAVVLSPVSSLSAAGVAKEATITQTFNDVRTLEGPERERPSRPNEVIRENQGVRTAPQARAELRFRDNALLRLGANTIFTFDAGANEYDLKQGTMMLQAPKGGGAKVRTAAITAAIVGTTIMLEYTPDVNPPPGSNKKKKKGYVKVIVLEGTLRLYINNRTGESVLLNAGQMIITSPDAVQLPPPVTVDIARLVETSLLVNNANWNGAASQGVALPLVNREIERQRELLAGGQLQQTNLIIPGRGTNVVLASASSGTGGIDAIQYRSSASSESSSSVGSGTAPPVTGPVFVNRPTTIDNRNTVNTPEAIISGGSQNVFATFYPGRTLAGGQDFAQYIFPGSVKPVDSRGPFGGFIQHITSFHSPIEVFKFQTLTISGTPSFITSRAGTGTMDNVPNVALVGVDALTLGGSTGTFNATGLQLITLVTENGPLTLQAGFTFLSPSTEVILHARGANGSLLIDGTANLGSELISAVAEQNFRLTGSFSGGSVNITAGNQIEVTSTGNFASSGLTLNADQSVLLGGTFNGVNSLTINSPMVTLTANQTIGASGTINAGAGGLAGGTFSLTGTNLNLVTTGGGAVLGGVFNLRDITLSGPLTAGNVTARNITGVAGGTITVAGGLNVQSLITLGAVSVGTLVAANVDVGGVFTVRDLTVNGNITANSVSQLSLRGADATTGPGGDGGKFTLTTTADINFPTSINATTGNNGAGVPTGGIGGSVTYSTSGQVVLPAVIIVSNNVSTRKSAQGGNISVTSTRAASPAITVGNTGQLLSLLDAAAPGPGGRITLVASGGGSIDVAGKLQAERGTVEVRNDAVGGTVNTSNTAEFRGSIVKIGALSANGTLMIGGGLLDADNTIKLYATGANGLVRFTANTTLSGTSVKTIAGQTVTIDNTRTVTILGPAPAQVFTNVPNYTGFGGNGSTTGTFGGQGATTAPLGGQPGF